MKPSNVICHPEGPNKVRSNLRTLKEISKSHRLILLSLGRRVYVVVVFTYLIVVIVGVSL